MWAYGARKGQWWIVEMSMCGMNWTMVVSRNQHVPHELGNGRLK
jgi:hypothetical protein